MQKIIIETNDTLNIIHLPNNELYPHRKEREDSFLKQIKEQNIKDYNIWEGVFNPDNTIQAVSQAHKQIVRAAKEQNRPRVIIAEDDFSFTNKGAWQYFLNSIPEKYDVFLSHIYHGKYELDTGKLKGPFASLTLYSVHNRFYDKFLSMPEDKHLDLVMNIAWRYDIFVCLPMVCRQINGYSENNKEYKNWIEKEKDKPMF